MDQKSEYSFGIDSNFGTFLFRYPWHTTFIIFLVVEGLVFFFEPNLIAIAKTTMLVLPILFVNLLIVNYFSKNYCYKVIINTQQKSIKLYPFFNRGVKNEHLENVKVVIHKTCDLAINNSTYTVFPTTLHEIVPYLPKNTEVFFSGFFGRIKKRDWERRNINLTPGKY